MKGFCTKYALSQGIFEVDADFNSSDPESVRVKGSHLSLLLSKEFFTEREAAEARARRMAVERIASLSKQITKLEKLVEEPKWRPQ